MPRYISKEKKTLTPTEELKHLKHKQRLLFAGEAGCAVLPAAFTAIFNLEDVIMKVEVWRTTVSFVMMAFMTLISVAIIAKGKFKVNLLTPLLILGCIDVLLWIMGDMITKLAQILLYVIAGFMGAFILELNKNKDTERIATLKEGIKKAETDIVAEEYREEIQKVKVRIKK